MESTNSYAANTLSKDYNTEDTSFIGCISTEDNTVLPSNDHLENFNSFTISNWIIDSGASLHVTYSINLLKNIKKCNESISLPNGKIVTSTKYGSFTGYVNNNEIKLNKVFYVPNITKNIISLSELIKHNYKVVFLNHYNKVFASLFDQHGNKITNIPSDKHNIFQIWLSNRIYNLKIRKHTPTSLMHLSTLSKAEKINLWHRRLGHFNISKILNKLSKINIPSKCQICSHSKLKDFPHKNSTNKSIGIFELIHMDLIGPIEESLHGNRYILSILDDFSRYGWVHFLSNKHDTYTIFHNWFIEINNIHDKSIKYIRTDNGTEFSNSMFKSFCASHGIIHQFTIPYNPQQNGRAERFNGTLINSAKALLNDAKLSHHFWEYTVETANYIHNRIPHSGIQNKIPYEILFKSKIDYAHFKVFGCRVFITCPSHSGINLTITLYLAYFLAITPHLPLTRF